jgi:hypothetical protein
MIQPGKPHTTLCISDDERNNTQTLRIFNTYCLPRQKRLHENATLLRYTYIACSYSSDVTEPKFRSIKSSKRISL